MTEASVELAAKAYIFGRPLVDDLEQVIRVTTTGIGTMGPAAYNTFGHARTLAGPDDRFVTINNDTVYSMASVDLSVGPVRLSVPATDGRYYVLQFVAPWTENFAYVGSRATGTGAGEFLLVPPEWTGAAEGLEVIRFPTRVASIVGRFACSGVDDLPEVHRLQDALSLTQLNPTLAPPSGVPAPAVPESPALAFFEKFRVWSQAFPPAPRDAELLASFAALGLTGTTPVAELPSEARKALEAGFAAGQAALEQSLHGSAGPAEGWQSTLHVFDYNLDYFEVGTIDSPEWKLDPKVRIGQRAAAAAAGLWGNHGYEAAYLITYVDESGEQLTGSRRYRLRLSPTPPVGAFWSLTMYDVPDFFLVANPIGRYSIGDRTPGIVFDDDGGITITISAEEPSDPVERANWLPAPSGDFRPVLRMYAPASPILDGAYRFSPIERI